MELGQSHNITCTAEVKDNSLIIKTAGAVILLDIPLSSSLRKPVSRVSSKEGEVGCRDTICRHHEG